MRLAIESMAYGADAIAHEPSGKCVFVSGAVAGDVVEAELTHEGSRFDRARASEVLEPSPDRVGAPCPWVGICGGCPWAHLSRPAQLAAKRANLVAALRRIGHLGAERVEALVGEVAAPSAPWGYRNKVEMRPVEDDRGRLALGFARAGGEGIVAVDRCPLLPSRYERLPKRVAGALGYLSRGRDLALTRVGIRASLRTGDVEVALWTRPGPFPRAMAAKVVAEGARATGVVRVMAREGTRKLAGLEVLGGRERWRERLAGHGMAVSAPSFFQVSTEGAEALIALVVDASAGLSDEGAFDLYSGAGTFTLPLARSMAWVEAVESYGPAVRDLRRNLERARLDNVEATGGDAAREMPEGPVGLVVLDPPRAGLSREAVEGLRALDARRLAYVSCGPETLARDIARLEASGSWRLERVQGVDLFPQTFHLETVCVLARTRP